MASRYESIEEAFHLLNAKPAINENVKINRVAERRKARINEKRARIMHEGNTHRPIADLFRDKRDKNDKGVTPYFNQILCALVDPADSQLYNILKTSGMDGNNRYENKNVKGGVIDAEKGIFFIEVKAPTSEDLNWARYVARVFGTDVKEDKSKIGGKNEYKLRLIFNDMDDIDNDVITTPAAELAKDYGPESTDFGDEEYYVGDFDPLKKPNRIKRGPDYYNTLPDGTIRRPATNETFFRKRQRKLKEDVESSMPVTVLPENEVIDAIAALPYADSTHPPRFFSLGYIKELNSQIPAKFRGGRGSEGNPRIRIFKCTEFKNSLYTGADYENLKATRAMRRDGVERSGERTGFKMNGNDNLAYKIGTSATGSKQLQAYIRQNTHPRVKYFISIDGGDLSEISLAEIESNGYLTPGAINAMHRERTNEGQPIVRLKLSGIYMINNLGHSIM